MKKLMIAAAIVCAAALSHGAALQWGISGIPNGDGAIVADSCFWIAAASMDDFNAAADKWTYVSGVDAADKATGTLSPGRGVLNAAGTYGDFDPGDPVQGFVVVFDAGHENYVASSFADFLAPGAGGASYSQEFSTTAGWKPNAGPGPESVPEPTSAMLILLGVAGLALRRKQA